MKFKIGEKLIELKNANKIWNFKAKRTNCFVIYKINNKGIRIFRNVKDFVFFRKATLLEVELLDPFT